MTSRATRDGVSADEIKRAREVAVRRRVLAERIWYGVLVVFAVALVAGGGIVAWSAYPGSCTTCHGETALSAGRTAHAGLSCEDCHALPTAVGLLESRLAVIDMVAATIVPRRTPVESNVESRQCLVCHEGGMTVTTASDGLRMNHRAPVDAGWECRSCHPGTGHEVAATLGGYTMDMCLSCHSVNPENLATCDVCHVEGARPETREQASPWRITHGANWESTHGMGDVATCGGCHAPSYCGRCHGANVPHPPNYLPIHGRDTLSRDDGAAQCLGCHRSDSCDGCHGIEMPHPVEFAREHATEMRADAEIEAVCARCHTEESCVACHVRHTHPGLTPETIEALRARPWTGR